MSRALETHHRHAREAWARDRDRQEWGPSHQQMHAPWQRERRHPVLRLIGWFLAAMFLHGVIDKGGRNEFFWCLNAMILGWLIKKLIAGIREDRIPVWWLLPVGRSALYAAQMLAVGFVNLLIRKGPLWLVELIARIQERSRARASRLSALSPATAAPSPAELARWEVQAHGGGAYLGESERGEWVCADPESAVMVLGPPRSGKTSAVMIPALLGAAGAVVSTSTKPDVMRATRRARSQLGDVWLFDPAGHEAAKPPTGVKLLRWSPVAAASSWDRALIVAKAMTASTHPGRGTTNETHWSERAGALLAPLLYAAHLTSRPIEEVLRWTLRQDMTSALEILGAQHKHAVAADVLIGIQRTDTRERSSIYSATAGVLAAYNADATRATAKDPNFDPDAFARGTDTLYITAPEHKQSLCAPLIAGLLEQIRHAVYQHAREQTPYHGGPRMLWALDEVANIAPIHDLPALVSQAGGQGLQVMIGLQDLSQARARWGQDAAEGFMSLFQTRLVLSGIADSKTLESISLALGEYDRTVFSATTGTSESEQWFSLENRSEGVSAQTHRQRTLTPGEIARLPDGHALLLQGGGAWELIRLTPWHQHPKWANVAHNSNCG